MSKERISSQRAKLIIKHPFFGYLALHLEIKEDPLILTMGTDGENLFFSPEFVNSLSDEDLQVVLMHEVLHCALGHLWRRENREEIRWNIACDYATNNIIKESGVDLPLRVLYDPEFSNLSAEEIYERIEVKKIVLGLLDNHSRWGGKGEEKRKELEGRWKSIAKEAIQQTRSQGNLPGSLISQIEEFVEPTLPWRYLLRKFVLSCARNHWTWEKPSKRHIWRDIYLPALKGESFEIVIAIDTSGSISDEELSIALSEINGICRQFEDYLIHLFQCDYSIQDYQLLRPGIPVPKRMKGRGGTSFIPIFEEVKKRGIRPNCLIYFTDLYGDFPKEKPLYPVIWVSYEDKEVPFGERITIKKRR